MMVAAVSLQGNVLVRAVVPDGGGDTAGRGGPARPQLVLLDHGLYRDVEPAVRLGYCRLWKSIVLADAAGVKAASDMMGVRSEYMEERFPGMSHTLLAAMLTQRGWDKIIDPDMGGCSARPCVRLGC